MLVTNPLLLVESPNFISDVSDDDVNDVVDEEDKYDDHMRYYWGKLVIYPSFNFFAKRHGGTDGEDRI